MGTLADHIWRMKWTEVKISPRLGPGSNGLTGSFLEEGRKWGSWGSRNEVLPTSHRDIRAAVGMEARHSWTDGGAPALETVLAGLQSPQGVYMATLSPAHRHPGERESF